MADLPVIPTRRPQPTVYTSLLVASTLLLLAGSLWIALKNQEMTSQGGSSQGGPFEYLAK
jgi:hypothetical protein